MIWVILVALGVLLWLCASGILTLVLQKRKLRNGCESLEVAAGSEQGVVLLGPFVATQRVPPARVN